MKIYDVMSDQNMRDRHSWSDIREKLTKRIFRITRVTDFMFSFYEKNEAGERLNSNNKMFAAKDADRMFPGNYEIISNRVGSIRVKSKGSDNQMVSD